MTCSAMVGVTVGVSSPHAELAALAAACFTEQTGISCQVLGQLEFSASGLRHPAALRLKLFELVDAARVVYFDADWFCLRPWDPAGAGDPAALLACRDFLLVDEWPRQHYDFASEDFNEAPANGPAVAAHAELRLDYIQEVMAFAGIGLPWSRWINSGLLVMSRTHHEPWLKHALALYEGAVGHHEKYYEQPALVKAMEHLELPLQLLPRRLNVLAACERKWPASVTGLHVKPSRNPVFVHRVTAGSISTPDQVIDHFRM